MEQNIKCIRQRPAKNAFTESHDSVIRWEVARLEAIMASVNIEVKILETHTVVWNHGSFRWCRLQAFKTGVNMLEAERLHRIKLETKIQELREWTVNTYGADQVARRLLCHGCLRVVRAIQWVEEALGHALAVEAAEQADIELRERNKYSTWKYIEMDSGNGNSERLLARIAEFEEKFQKDKNEAEQLHQITLKAEMLKIHE